MATTEEINVVLAAQDRASAMLRRVSVALAATRASVAAFLRTAHEMRLSHRIIDAFSQDRQPQPLIPPVVFALYLQERARGHGR